MIKTSKLSHTILKSVSIRVLGVILLSSTLSYLHLYRTIEKGTKDTLQKYVSERTKREEALFLLAQKNHKILKEEITRRLEKTPTKAELSMFDVFFRKWPDGTIRNKKETYDGTKSAGVFIPPNTKITDELKYRILVLKDLAETYGKAFRNGFQDTYFSTSERIMIVFWPEDPNWTMKMEANFDINKEEYVWVADLKHNPERKSVWTGSYYDKIGDVWMTSAETPLDAKGWSITIGHDAILNDLVKRVSSEHLEGTNNIIFRADGRLITHPTLFANLASDKILNLKTIDDPSLRQIYEAVTTAKMDEDGTTLIEHPNGKNDIAFSKLSGPDWYFVTVYPHSLIVSTALNGIMFIIILALASLAFEIAFLYYGLKRDVIEPLRKMEESVTKISHGEYQARLNIDRTDELGQLADSFNQMAQKISDNEKSLIAKVDERTRQIDEQRALIVQKSKLASLGELAGGIAHEINTPLAIIGIKVEQLTESIEENDLNPEEFKASLEVIKMTSDRIAKIISGLRFVARDGSQLPMEKASLNMIISEVFNFGSEQLRLLSIKMEIIKNFDDGLFLNCRAVELSQVLLNLLNNAKDAVQKLDEKWIKLEISDHGSSIEMSMTDSGHGIPLEIQEKIMMPFFTTKDIGKGTGLGLSISKGIIEAHKGKLFIDNTSPNTKFVIILPKN